MARNPAVPALGRRLEDTILAGFKEAHATERLDVAEHLLSALECVDRTAGRGGAVEEAYSAICRDCKCESTKPPTK